MTNEDSDAKLIAEIEKRIEEGTEFEGLERVPALKPRNPRAVFSVRLSPEEFSLIKNAATARGSNVSDYIREVAVEAATIEGQQNDEAYDLADIKADVSALNRKIERAMKHRERDSRIA